MAHGEDPPYLTVGTEVSAKYRGAFCEATIKIAKKLVKCKVSYGKGQSAVITSDLIKGHLKVGGQVEVKHADGQLQQASITKLTDHSTYTVVFDDGDERTLKRSSLCLKGGRHFHESESLDHLPLTDPENFGTPVMTSSSKPGRKRRRGSHSPSSSPSKRRCNYPLEFPVGKAVFLVNDRRRASWLPAVIVPAHYVLEASDMTPDTICLRSFKDGRYFAATKDELHEFSPDKEPLQSMLEGEIPAMYMCKPAIERAMAYIDTGELPWDMDLLDHNSGRRALSHSLVLEPLTSDDEDLQRNKEELLMAEAAFEAQLQQFYDCRGTVAQQQRHPAIGQHDLNLFQLYRLVRTNGGMDKVTQEMKWRSLYLQLGLPPNAAASQALRQAYKKFLYQFELHENKAKSGKELTRHIKPCPLSSDEDQDTSHDQSNQQDRAERQQDKVKRQDRVKELKQQIKVEDKCTEHVVEGAAGVAGVVKEEVSKVNGVDKQRALKVGEQRALKVVKVEKLQAKQIPLKPPAGSFELEEEDDKNVSDSKSEGGSDLDLGPANADRSWYMDSDLECSTSLSADNLERGELPGNLEQCPDGYKINNRVLVLYGKGKTLLTYEAKVVEIEESAGKQDYLVHYSGWNTRYDEWIDSTRIAGKITGSGKTRAHFYPKRKKTPKSASSGSVMVTPPPNISLSAPTFSSSQLVFSSPPSSSSSASSPTTSKLLSPSAINSKLLLSPSLQAIISGNQQTKVLKKDKGYDSISGKDISCRPPLALKPSPAPKLERSMRRTTARTRALQLEDPKSKDDPDHQDTNSNSSSAPTTPTTPTPASKGSPLAMPSSEEEEDQPILVRQEENQLWLAEPLSPATPSNVAASDDSAAEGGPSALCSEHLPGLAPLSPSALSLAEPAAQSLLSLSTAMPASFHSQAASPLYSRSPSRSPSPPDPAVAMSPRHTPKEEVEGNEEGKAKLVKVENVEASSISSGIDFLGTLECAEHKSLYSASGNEGSPLPQERRPPSKAHHSLSPDSKKKWCGQESPEEYERRKKARHEEMSYALDFSQLLPMSSVERVLLIQARLKAVQQQWSNLKSEVAYIERKRRRARHKEREAAVQPPPPALPSSLPSSPHKPQLNHSSAISCH